MSKFFCTGCQQNKDLDFDGFNLTFDGEFCDSCYNEKINNEEVEKIAKQVDGNSLEIIELGKRVKNLEENK